MAKLEPIPKGEVITDSITKHIDKRFLSSLDLMGAGVVALTIDRVEKLAVLKYGNGRSDDNAILVYFKGTPKPLKLCKANIRAISYGIGSSIAADWTGKKVVLKIMTVQVKGEATPAIRVDADLTKAANEAKT